MKLVLAVLALGAGSPFLLAAQGRDEALPLNSAFAHPSTCSDPFVDGFPRQIGTELACTVVNADAVWTGSSIVATWDQVDCGVTNVAVVVVDPFGVPIHPETTIYSGGQKPQVVWTGSEAAVVWRSKDYNYMARLDPLSGLVADPTVIGPACDSKSVVWTGSKYSLFWFYQHDLTYTRIDEAGYPFRDTVLGTGLDNVAMYGPSLVWTGTYYGLVYYNAPFDRPDFSGLVLATVNTNGQRVRETLITSTQYALNTAIARNGDEIAVVWSDRRDGFIALYFARFDALGRRLGPDVRLTDLPGRSPVARSSLAWNGTEYGLAWGDRVDGNYEIYFTRLSAAGEKLGEVLRVTSASGVFRLLWMGDAYGLLFVKDPVVPLRFSPHFQRIGCR